MIMVLWILLSLAVLYLFNTANPVKLAFTVTMMMLVTYTTMIALNCTMWVSGIFFMIFIGGIMIMFMILSSLMPNEKVAKVETILTFTLVSVIFFFLLSTLGLGSSTQFYQQVKIMFYSNWGLEAMAMVIFMYFLSFIYIISKDSTSLRSFLC